MPYFRAKVAAKDGGIYGIAHIPNRCRKTIPDTLAAVRQKGSAGRFGNVISISDFLSG